MKLTKEQKVQKLNQLVKLAKYKAQLNRREIIKEKSMKSIAAMKKSPANYKEELERHKIISQLGRQKEYT